MVPQFPLLNKRFDRREPELYGVFECYDMRRTGLVHFIDNGGDHRGLADPRETATQDQTVIERCDLVERGMEVKLIYARDVPREDTDRKAQSPGRREHVDPEAYAKKGNGYVKGPSFPEGCLLLVTEKFLYQIVHLLVRKLHVIVEFNITEPP